MDYPVRARGSQFALPTLSPDVMRLSLGLAAMVATAALIWFGTGLDPFWPLMWIAPVPVLVFAVEASWWGTAAVSGFAMILGILNARQPTPGVLEALLTVLTPLYLTAGVMFALATLLFRALVRRKAYWSALLAFPSFWVSFEWLLNLTWPHGTGGSLAYSQLRFLPFLQLASITGPWGMTFLLWAFAAALALAISLRNRSRKVGYRILVATAAVVAAVLTFGTARLRIVPPAATVQVGLVASDGPNEHVAGNGAPTERLFRAYGQRVAQLAEEGATVVVLPEKTGVVTDSDIHSVDAELQSIADRNAVRVVAGVVRVARRNGNHGMVVRYNEARIYTPGAPVASYDKEHMLPPWESDLTPGTALTVLKSSRGRGIWGVAICKDMDFTQLSRRYGEAGVGLMLVPAWDFFFDWIQHGHMALMRGVESGFSMVRSAKGGSLFVSDDRGRILAETKSDSAPFSSLLVSVPQTHDNTLFQLLGDWLAWVALAILLFCLAQLVRLRKSYTE